MQRTQPGPSQPLALDYGVKSAFLSQLDAGQKLQIFDLTTRASRELHRWAARYPLMRRVRVWPLCLSVVAAAPFASVPALVTMARVNLWGFTIDDLFDEEVVPFAQLQRRVAKYKAIVAGERVDQKHDRDTLALALQDIRDDLQSYPLFQTLQHEWAGAVANTLDAMLLEHQWRIHYRSAQDAMPLPTHDAYLQYGIYSIAAFAHIWTALIAINDSSTLNHLERLQQMARSAAICIRLANDLQSHTKEVAEGKINSLVIRQQEAIRQGYAADIALEHAREAIRQDIQHALNDCIALQQQAHTTSSYPERAITDIARFVCDFYEHHDYHTFATNTGRVA